MFRTELIFGDQKRPVQFFEDDTISTVRQQIAKSIDIHHDRLFALVGVNLTRNHYKNDKRNWETLFYRISLNGLPIQKETFDAYCKEYRYPPLDITFEGMDREEWMTYPAELMSIWEPRDEFVEYRILGVEPIKSYCLPLSISGIASQIPAAQYPIPENSRLFLSFYSKITDFKIIEYNGAESPYFPFFKSETPLKLSLTQLNLLDSNANHLENLLKIDPPAPSKIHITRALWSIDLVDTEPMNRTRIEQIFYGLTVSKDVPCISFFTDKTDVSRHKFYKEDPKKDDTYLELPVWSAWWTKSKPARKGPTLVLYRGKDRIIFDRIAITAQDINFAVYRDSSNKKDLNELKKEIVSWFSKFDAIVPFIESSDLTDCRFKLLPKIQLDVEYSTKLEQFDLRRMNCFSTVFQEDKKDPTKFRFLRADYESNGITPLHLQIISLLQENPFIKPSEISTELKLSLADSTNLLREIHQRIEEEPNLLTRKNQDVPLLEINPEHPKNLQIKNIDDISRYLKYTNLLRYVLEDPKSKDVDRVCPKRLETVEAVITKATTNFDDADFGDLFTDLETDKAPEKEEAVKPRGQKKSEYGYFYRMLQDFDPLTFASTKSVKNEYPKKCEKSHQPVVLSDAEIADILETKGAEFTTKEYPDDKKLEISEPDGVVSCPNYWCMYDKIPLQEEQLEDFKGNKVCPLCHGKIREAGDEKSDSREFSVIKRDKSYPYPKLMNNYISPANQKGMPCCFKNPEKKKLVKIDHTDERYYILGETKELLPLRLAYLPMELIKNLKINEKYGIKSSNRISTGMSGYFRVGLKNISKTLPTLLNITKIILPPHKTVTTILRCNFIASWPRVSEKYASEVEKTLEKIKPFSNCKTSRQGMSRIISSISEEFEEGKLLPVQELEYICILLNINAFKINVNTLTVGCLFPTKQSNFTYVIMVLQVGSDIDCLSHILRQQKKFVYKTNIAESPFNDETRNEIANRNKAACFTYIPSYSSVFIFVTENISPNFSIVLDPLGRAQAIYIPGELILPFQNTPFPTSEEKRKRISGYHEIEDLPSYAKIRAVLELSGFPGYEWQEDIYDISGSRVEILTKSGLRIPVVPEPADGITSEVTSTAIKEGETALVFGKPNEEDDQRYKSVSYASEIFDFIIFQLTKDIEDDSGLKEALLEKPINREILEEWFTETLKFSHIEEPIEFLSKIRKPCGQLKNKKVCETAHMCVWDGRCSIQVRDSISKTKLFNKLLGTLTDNSKTLAMILDGRTTPFFSTILYLQLPNEIIYTDIQLKNL